MNKKIIALLMAAVLISPLYKTKAQITQQLFYNASNSQVTELQTDLKSLGYFTSNIDGTFGYNTYLGVKALQTANGLPVTGSLDFLTLDKLNKLMQKQPSVLYYGMSNDKVTELQTYLYGLNYLSVSPTGYFGTLTKAGVSKLQQDNGMTVTGQADSALFSKIFTLIDAKFVPTKSYTNYTVVKGDNVYNIALKFQVTQNDILNANSLTASSILNIGQVLRIPKINVPVKPTYAKYGEYLDWFTEAQYVFPIGATAKVIDYFSGKSFTIKRTIGAGHADCETLTAADTAMMKEIFNGVFSWEFRPIVLEVNGRRLAASIAGMPHAGLDAYAADINVNGRSDNYGYGPNLDYIKGNNMDGHFDIHFPGSLRHKDWLVDPRHQDMIKISSGRQ